MYNYQISYFCISPICIYIYGCMYITHIYIYIYLISIGYMQIFHGCVTCLSLDLRSWTRETAAAPFRSKTLSSSNRSRRLVISGSGNPPKWWLDWLDWLDEYVSVMTIGTKSSSNGRFVHIWDVLDKYIYELLFKWV